jgi:hypothetical protein
LHVTKTFWKLDLIFFFATLPKPNFLCFTLPKRFQFSVFLFQRYQNFLKFFILFCEPFLIARQVELPDWPETPRRDDDDDDDDAEVWSSASALVRAALIRLVPDAFRSRIRQALATIESTPAMASLPLPLPTFLYFILLIAVIRRYPLPTLLALLPLIQQRLQSPRSAL